ncbi:MAG: nucleoside-diphosphate sugar epimerase/dehydratase [Candidatus Faecousia sp.]|nr:nucleoside-diphosphate sugar epimerase/dehydratase [Bacillota bacterium]MDY6041213.1 nucleoside-diphosphate sugar epimerase/dehydratase [Candidatus Faecousia sp.]
MKKMRIRGTKEWKEKAILVGTLDLVTILGSYFLALLLRFDFLFSSIDPSYVEGFLRSILPWAAVTIAVFYVCRLYHSIWSLASTAELLAILRAYLILLPVYWVLKVVLKLHMPRSYYVVGFIINFCMTTGMRFSYRVLRTQINDIRHGGRAVERIMLIGGGAAGQMLIKEMQNSSRVNAKICCVIDDNPNKKGRFIEGIEIVGNRYDIVNMAKKYRIDTIIYAIPSNDLKERTAILNICKETQCRLRTIPGMYQLVNDEVRVSMLRDVDIADLLGREQVSVNNDEILTSIKGLTVLVTGGGGSIGSELCRQIAKANPRQLIIFEIYENNAYEIQQELKRRYPELNLVTLIGSVRNTSRINDVMKTYRPDVVFHAAAHKHVPLMEDSPNEAIKNNVFGTYKTAMAAAENGVHKFVLISTDKAVNPTNIMGASKRLCEMVVQMMDRRYADTSFVAVRFGNVLGSNGSVIPLFKKQIAEGGPVTVTDKRVIRYFMTIPEAVSLVLQAAYYATGGEIFILEMGDPVKIDDMARNLIRLSGFTPDVDIPIVYTGLRPGEKLYEELLMGEEGMQETANRKIHIGKPIEMDDAWFMDKLRELDEASRAESDDIRRLVSEVVPTYHYQNTRQKEKTTV